MRGARLLLFILMLCLPGFALANAKLLSVGCSAALFKMEGMSLDQKALILTAGHCVNHGSMKDPEPTGLVFPGPGQVLRDMPDVGQVAISGADGKLVRYRFSRIVLATMTGMDAAILELDQTYRAILDKQADAEIYELSPITAWTSAPMRIESTYWRRDFSCEVDKIVPTVKEDPWTWTDVVRFHLSPRCRLFGGVSGSPVLDQNHRIVAVANTASDPGAACSFVTPCEIGDDGQPFVAPNGQSYATSTARFYDCYSADRQAFDFDLPSCRLVPTDPSTASLASGSAPEATAATARSAI
jgi:hypothetical protein